MKAVSVDWEISVYVSKDEIENLRHFPVRGVISRRSMSDVVPLELRVGEIDERNLFAEVFTVPEKVYCDDAEEFQVVLSEEGYSRLSETGAIGDRMARNSACKVGVYLRGFPF